VPERNFEAFRRRLKEDAQRDSPTREHIVSVEQQIADIERGDFDAALSNADPDIELDVFAPPEFKWVAHARGIDAVRRALEVNFTYLQDQTPEILNVVSQEESVVLIGRDRGRIRATGQPYDVEFVDRFTFSGGRLRSIRVIAAHRNGP
jgi:ketosteroid isomerase-like protein